VFNIEHLHMIRAAEIERLVSHLRPGARILEVGAGTGQQTKMLWERGFDVTAIEMVNSNYVDNRVVPITDYDGRNFPFGDASFDIVFSSNVLEHVPDLTQMHAETARVLRPGGYALHIMPTHVWRFWTTVSAFPDAAFSIGKALPEALPRWPFGWSEVKRLGRVGLRIARYAAAPFFQRRHGERGNTLSETFLFHPDWWRENFRANGFEVVRDEPLGLFYTGNMVRGLAWPVARRAELAKRYGSACHLFEVKPARRP
jgi:SAM-dependent methyltransferase